MATTSSAEATLDALEDPVLVRGPDGRVVYANAAAAGLFGEAASALVGRRPEELLSEPMREVGGQPFFDWLERPGPHRGRPCRVSVRRRDGLEIQRSLASATTTAAGGETHMLLLLRPPSAERDVDYDPLHNHSEHPGPEEIYRAVFDAVPVGVLHFDARARITDCNDVFVQQMGSSRGVLTGLDMLTLPNEGVRAAVREALDGHDGHFDGEYVSATGGRRRTLRALFSPVTRDGRVEGGVGVVEDVTEQRQIELRLAQGERMASLGRLAAGVAHEINNPLAYVRTSLDIALRELERVATTGADGALGRAIEVLRHADDGVERVRVIASDLKTFSRGDDGSWVPVDLARVVDAAVNLAWNEIRHRAELVRETAPAPRVMGSETRFVQVLVNLLLNAAQAIPEGDVANQRITLRIGSSDDGERAFVEVADTGTGIATDRVEHIFEPFWSSKPRGVGTGLGLSICHGIVTAAGGDIWVAETEPGRGTTLRIELPAAPASTPRAVSAPVAAPPAPAVTPRARILVIDDEPRLATTLKLALGEDYDVSIATSGRDALERIEELPALDLVLCDLMMPEMSGMDLYELVLEQRPEVARKFAFMTGGAFTERARTFLKTHGRPRLEKPFTIADVERLLGSDPPPHP